MLSSPNDESPANVEAAVSDNIFVLHFWSRKSMFRIKFALIINFYWHVGISMLLIMYCRKNGEKEGRISERKLVAVWENLKKCYKLILCLHKNTINLFLRNCLFGFWNLHFQFSRVQDCCLCPFFFCFSMDIQKGFPF